MEKLLAFDVETPNHRNDRICAIGLTVIEDGEITANFHSLVNPECAFDDLNVRLHGIGPGDVTYAPVFPEIWDQIGGLFRTHLVAAHNANFDLCVLRKTLTAYGIAESLVYYVDTLAIARAMVKETPNHRLPTLCRHFDIPLEHHDAKSDSHACASLLLCFLDSGADLDRFTRSFNLESACGPSAARQPRRLSANSQSLLTLSGILSGITCDNVLVEAEVYYLQEWLDANIALKGNYPYDKIYSTLSSALADGVLTSREMDYMLKLFKQVTNPVAGDDCACGSLDIQNKSICLSGEFDCGSKGEVGGKLTSLGAAVQSTLTQRTDILLVGGRGSCAWSAGNYGNKVKKALEMQARGIRIDIFREADFFAALEG